MKKKRKRPDTPEVCPVCGEDVPPKALACPECGACHNSGWKEDAHTYDALDLPDDEFDYDEFVKEEFGGGSKKPKGMSAIWWVTGIVLFLYLLSMLMKGWIFGDGS